MKHIFWGEMISRTLTLSCFFVLSKVVNANVQPNLNGMTLPPNFQSYNYIKDLSMDRATSWITLNSAKKTSDFGFGLANESFGFVHSLKNLPSTSYNFRIELDLFAKYATNSGTFGLLLFKANTVPLWNHTNMLSQISGLKLFHNLCQNGTLSLSYGTNMKMDATDITDKSGTSLVTPCSQCQGFISSPLSPVNYQMIVQIVNEHVTVNFISFKNIFVNN